MAHRFRHRSVEQLGPATGTGGEVLNFLTFQVAVLAHTGEERLAPDPVKQRIIDAFNRRAESVFADMALVAPKKDGLVELLPYLIDVFWLDLGQLLYILDRANTVWDAFRPLKHITFSSRDFWTELAHADRAGLTQGKWRPAS